LYIFGKLFAAFGSTGLSNKMAAYTTDQKAFDIDTFYSSGGSCVAADGQCRAEFSVPVAPSTGTVYWIIELSEETGNMCDKRAKGCKECCCSFA
jgi:hypothetical protein